MTDNVSKFQVLKGGGDEVTKPPLSEYTVVHSSNGETLASKFVGYSMSTDTLFMITDANFLLTFAVPIHQLVYLTATALPSVVPSVYTAH